MLASGRPPGRAKNSPQKANGIFAAWLNPWDRLAAGIIIDAVRESKKGDEDARLWLEMCGVDLLGAIIPSSVEPEHVMQRLMQGHVSL